MRLCDPFLVRERCRDYADRPEPAEIDKEGLGAAIGEMEKALKALNLPEGFSVGDERKLILGFLFGDPDKPPQLMSSKALTAQQVYGLKRWVGATSIGGKWYPRKEFRDELYWARARARNFKLTSDNNGCTINELIELCKEQHKQSKIDIEEGGLVEAGIRIGGDLTATGAGLPELGPIMRVMRRHDGYKAEIGKETQTAMSGSAKSNIYVVDSSEF